VSKPSASDIKTLTEKLGCYKSAGTGDIAAELIQAEGRQAGQYILTH
jgi:hypothetical protein